MEVAAEKNATLVLPLPVELLRFLDRAANPTDNRANPPEQRATSADRKDNP